MMFTEIHIWNNTKLGNKNLKAEISEKEHTKKDNHEKAI